LEAETITKMIKADIKGTEYEIPTSWADVPYIKAIEVIKIKEPDLALCKLIGIDIELLNNLQNKSVAILYNCVQFISDVSIMEKNEPKEKYKDFDYGSKSYGDTEKVRNIISQNSEKSFLDLAPEIIKHLTGDDISNEPFSEVIGSVDFFLKQWMLSTASTMSLTKVAEMKNQSLQELKGSTNSEASVLTLS
jgi:hypothetical protein